MNKTMHKTTFVKGALITTLGIVVSKILGLFYVIPFHAIIGDRGGALYGYAYTIYTFFMSIASAGIPLAVSKVVSEYQALGYYQVKKRAFLLSKKISLILGVSCFLIISLCAPFLAKAILGGISGGNSVEDVCFVIRVISTAILFVPVLSIYRGYFEGHRIMRAPSISQVLEQLIRVLIIIFGSFLTLKVFHWDIKSSVGMALFGATVGAFAAYIYLVVKYLNNKSKFYTRARNVNEPFVSDKAIIQKIFYYAIPFIMIDVFKSLYNTIDMVSVVRGLVNVCKYSTKDAEVIYSVLSTWGQKFNMIILAVSTGIIVSLIPNLTESVVKKQEKEVNSIINRAFSILLFFILPMAFGISFLSVPIWNVFYGYSKYGADIISYYIFLGLMIGLFTSMIVTLETLKDYKCVLVSLISGVLVKLVLNNYLLKSFYNLSFPAYYGVITASILGYLTSFIICLVVLKKKYNISFEVFLKNLIDILCGSMLMVFILYIFKLIIPITLNNRILDVFVILLYTLIGIVTYFIYNNKTKTFKRIFGLNIKQVINKYLSK